MLSTMVPVGCMTGESVGCMNGASENVGDSLSTGANVGESVSPGETVGESVSSGIVMSGGSVLSTGESVGESMTSVGIVVVLVSVSGGSKTVSIPWTIPLLARILAFTMVASLTIMDSPKVNSLTENVKGKPPADVKVSLSVTRTDGKTPKYTWLARTGARSNGSFLNISINSASSSAKLQLFPETKEG